MSILLVINKGVHEQTLVNKFFPLRLLIGQVSVVVIGNDDAIRLVSQLYDEAVVIADHASSLHTSRRGEDQDLLLF